MVVVLMGVSGSGKTSVGVPLAAALGGEFVEGDDYHPPANVAKMRQGIPLDDADRRPWLETLAAEIGRWLAAGRTVVLACSALKRSYRAILRGGRPEVRFVHLKGDPALIRARLARAPRPLHAGEPARQPARHPRGAARRDRRRHRPPRPRRSWPGSWPLWPGPSRGCAAPARARHRRSPGAPPSGRRGRGAARAGARPRRTRPPCGPGRPAWSRCRRRARRSR